MPQTAILHFCPAVGQSAPGSIWQVLEQPSPLALLPSSHCSPLRILPSPHLAMQALPTTRHWYPVSTVLQSAEQPSPLAVLPSSHCSLPSRTPLPHVTAEHLQRCPGVHWQPASILLQSDEQPSPSFWLPSSHTSPFEIWTTPSPHRGAGLQGEPGIGQTKPPSSWQVLLQPSLLSLLPSSQSSPASMRLLPHWDIRTQGCPGGSHL